MPRKYFRKYLPSHDSVRQNKYLAKLGGFLHHPNLWHLNRRSVSGGVAIGLFSGLVPGPFQMIAAALFAIPLRVNLPVALITTLYTNPFTIVPLYIAAYGIGSIVTGSDGPMSAPPEFSWAHMGAWLAGLAEWCAAYGKPLAVGLAILAASLAALGWIVVRIAWRAWVVAQWRRRKLRRTRR